MADENNTDDQDKTEEPTPRRLEKSAEEGRVAFSKELLHWTVLACGAAFLLWIVPSIVHIFFRRARDALAYSGHFKTSYAEAFAPPTVYRYFFDIVMKQGLFLLPLVLILILVGFLQTRFNIAPKNLMPKGERLSPLKGMGRIFSKNNIVEFLKNLAKVSFVAGVMLWVMLHALDHINVMPHLNMGQGLQLLKTLFIKLFLSALVALGIIALLDFAYQRYTHWKQLRMTRQEVKDETKEQEGSAEVKSKQKQMRLAQAQNRMHEQVEGATVLITNPTHYAVALKWDEATMETPKVVAKGIDHLALRMREIADAHKIPRVENPPLARSLYNTIEVKQDIAPEHYRAVADIIKHIQDIENQWFK